MREQMLDADLLRRRGARKVGDEFRERIVVRECPLLDELRDRHRREHLVHGAQVELRVELVRHAEVLVRLPEGACVQGLPVLREHDGTRKHVSLGEGSDVLLDGLRHLRVARHTGLTRRRRRARRSLAEPGNPKRGGRFCLHHESDRLSRELPLEEHCRPVGRFFLHLDPFETAGLLPLPQDEIEVRLHRQRAHPARERGVDVRAYRGRSGGVDERDDFSRSLGCRG